jgi:hypothetical protein
MRERFVYGGAFHAKGVVAVQAGVKLFGSFLETSLRTGVF